MSWPLTSFAKRLTAEPAGRTHVKRPSMRLACGLRNRRVISVSESMPSTAAFTDSSSRARSYPSGSESAIGAGVSTLAATFATLATFPTLGPAGFAWAPRGAGEAPVVKPSVRTSAMEDRARPGRHLMA